MYNIQFCTNFTVICVTLLNSSCLVFEFILSPLPEALETGRPVEQYQVLGVPHILAQWSTNMVYFIVICETDFYIHLKEFLKSLTSEIIRKIHEKKARLFKRAGIALREQSVFEGIFILILVMIAPTIGMYHTLILQMTLIAVFFHFLYLSLMTFLFLQLKVTVLLFLR